MVAKYRKKPIVIEAEQWTGNPKEMPIPPVSHSLLRQDRRGGKWYLKTLEGWYVLTPGDWLITGIAGEIYPCKPDIFEATYEPEEELAHNQAENKMYLYRKMEEGIAHLEVSLKMLKDLL